jgi:hypothetical protein
LEARVILESFFALFSAAPTDLGPGQVSVRLLAAGATALGLVVLFVLGHIEARAKGEEPD